MESSTAKKRDFHADAPFVNTAASVKEIDDNEPEVTGNFRDHPLADEITGRLRGIFDPEIPVNIYDLGLIYRIDVDDRLNIDIDMSLTAPGCPVAGEMPGMVSRALEPMAQVGEITVTLVWDPAWTQARMTELAKLELGWF